MDKCPCNKNRADCYTVGMAETRKLGQVIVTEGNRNSLISKTTAWATGSWFTHVFVVTGADTAVEAFVPRVREFKLSDRMRELRQEKRAYAVLDHSLTLRERCRLVDVANASIGKFYDVGQALIYGTWRRFYKDGPGTLICSRLITHIYSEIGIDLMDDEWVAQHFDPASRSVEDLKRGMVTPADLLKSRLRVVRWRPSPSIPDWRGVTCT